MSLSKATRVPILHNKHYRRNGTKSLVYLYHKYGIKPTTSGPYQRGAHGKLTKTLADGTSGEVTADDQQNDSFYTCPVQIGTPAQTLNLDFDSGSADLWVWSTELSSSIQKSAPAGVSIFNASKSSTFKKTAGSTWKIQYGDSSSASGDVGTDTVEIGDITIKNQSVELASTISAQFQTSGSSGLLGLAFGSINTVTPTPVATPVDNMISQKDIPQSLFTAYLGSVKDESDPDKGESFYTFGAIDETVVTASGQEISYTPVDNSQGFWMFDSTSAVVNGTSIALSGNTAIADTGTTLLLVSDQVCKAVYAAIPGATFDNTQQGYVIPASVTAAQLPTVTLAVGSKQFTINKEHLKFSQTDTSNSSSTWFGGIQSRGSMTFDIFGDVFLQNVYAIFDAGNTQFGCVQRADPTPNGPSTSTTTST